MYSLSFLAPYTSPIYEATRNTLGKSYARSAIFLKNSQNQFLSRIKTARAQTGESLQATRKIFAKSYKEFAFWINGSKSKIVLRELKVVLQSHKKWIAGGAAFCIALVVFQIYKRTVPNKPLLKAELTTSAHYGILKVTAAAPEQKNSVALNFCIDISSSMSGDNLNSVKSALLTVIKNTAIKNKGENCEIHFSIVSFNDSAYTLVSPVKIDDASQRGALEEIKKLRAHGGTNFSEGFSKSYPHIETMLLMKEIRDHYFVFLTDGQSSLPDEAKFSRLKQERIKKIFVGIGKHIDERTLTKMKDTYGGTFHKVQDSKSLKNILIGIYNDAVDPKISYELRSNLSSLLKLSSSNFSIERGEQSVNYIKISTRKLNTDVDMDKVFFTIAYQEDGEERTIPLKWNPSAILNYKIIQEAKENLRSVPS